MHQRTIAAAAGAALVLIGLLSAAPAACAADEPAPPLPATPPPPAESGSSFSFAIWFPGFDLEAQDSQFITVHNAAGTDLKFPLVDLGMQSIGEGLTLAQASPIPVEEGRLSSRLLLEFKLFGRPLLVDFPSKLISYGISPNGAAFGSGSPTVLSSLEIQFVRVGYSIYDFGDVWGTIYAGISSQRFEVTVLDTNNFSRVGHVVHSSLSPGLGWFIGGVDTDSWFQYFRFGLWSSLGANSAFRLFFHFRLKTHLLGAEAELLWGGVTEQLRQGRIGDAQTSITIAGLEVKLQVALAAAGTGAHDRVTAISPKGAIGGAPIN